MRSSATFFATVVAIDGNRVESIYILFEEEEEFEVLAFINTERIGAWDSILTGTKKKRGR